MLQWSLSSYQRDEILRVMCVILCDDWDEVWVWVLPSEAIFMLCCWSCILVVWSSSDWDIFICWARVCWMPVDWRSSDHRLIGGIRQEWLVMVSYDGQILSLCVAGSMEVRWEGWLSCDLVFLSFLWISCLLIPSEEGSRRPPALSLDGLLFFCSLLAFLLGWARRFSRRFEADCWVWGAHTRPLVCCLIFFMNSPTTTPPTTKRLAPLFTEHSSMFMEVQGLSIIRSRA